MKNNTLIPVTNITIDIPAPIAGVMNALQKSGYHAFIVGGCIRDYLLGLPCSDWDIATSAKPDEIKRALSAYRTIDTGLRHGTVTAVLDDTVGAGRNEVDDLRTAEITTFRIDGSYSDARHPDDVRFADTIEDDLSRRDFTINAMAYSDERGLIDIYGGISDLRHGIIRAVGDPRKRIGEDALRIMRALRFAAVLGFDIDAETACALHDGAPLLSVIASERITSEFDRFIVCASSDMIDEYRDVLGVFIPELLPMVGFEQHNPFHSKDVWYHTLNVVDNVRSDLALKLAAIFHDIGKPRTFSMDAQGKGHFFGHGRISHNMTREIMARMKYPGDIIELVAWMVEYHDYDLFPDERNARKNLGLWGADKLKTILELQMADQIAHVDLRNNIERIKNSDALLDRIVYEGPPVTLADLAVDGNDLIDAGLGLSEGPELGRLLGDLLEAVLDDPALNTRETLLRIAAENRSSVTHTPSCL